MVQLGPALSYKAIVQTHLKGEEDTCFSLDEAKSSALKKKKKK